MRSQRRSLFYKTLLAFILLGTLPAFLISARLVLLNENILQAEFLDATISGAMIHQLNARLWSEATAYIVSIFIFSGLVALFFSGGLIGPIRKLQLYIENLRKGDVSEITFHTGDEIDELGFSVISFGHELLRLQQDLEDRVAERTQSYERRSIHLQAAAEIAREAANLTNLDSFFLRVVNLVRERFNVYYVAIFLLDDAKRNAVLRAGTGEVGRLLFQREYKVKVGDVGIISHVTATGKPRLVNNVDDDFVFNREPLLPDTRSEVVLPLKIEKQVIGVLDIHSNQVDGFSEENLAALELVGDQLAIAIQNNKLVQQLQIQLSEIRSLYQRYVQEEWLKPAVFNQNTGYVYDSFSIHPISQDFPDDLIEILKTGKVVPLSAQDCQEYGIENEKAMLLAPMMVFNQLVGVIGMESEDPMHRWSMSEITAVQDITKQITLALDNARLLEESQYRTDQLRLLQVITAASVSHNHLRDLLGEICGKLLVGFQLDHCEAILFDVDRQMGTLVANASVDPEVPDLTIGTCMSFREIRVFENLSALQKTLVVYNAQNDPNVFALRDMLSLNETNVLILSPLVSQGNVIGLISMGIVDPGRRISPDEIALLDQISLQVSSAVNLTLTLEAAQQKAEFERELSEVAGRIRETLDLHTIMRTTAQEVRRTFGVPEAVIRLAPSKITPPVELD